MENKIILDGVEGFWNSFGSLTYPASSRKVFITAKALKLSKPDVGSSQNKICGFVSNCVGVKERRKKMIYGL